MLCSLLVHLFSIFEGLVTVHFGCQGPCPSHKAVYWLCYQTHQLCCCRRVQLKFISWSLYFGLFCRSPLSQQFQLSVTEHVSGTFFVHIQTLRIILPQFSQCWTTTAGDELYSSPKMKMCSARLFCLIIILHALRTLASCWNKENLDVKRRKWRKVKDWREFSGQPLTEV